MTTTELIQRQRDLARSLTNEVNRYQRVVTDATAHLEEELAKIESARQQGHQEAKSTYEKVIEEMFTPAPVKDEKRQLERERQARAWKQKVLAAAEVAGVTPARDLESVNAVKSAIDVLSSTKIISKLIIFLILIAEICVGIVTLAGCFGSLAIFDESSRGIGIGSLVVFVAGFGALTAMLAVLGWRNNKTFVSRVARLKALHMRWLEIVESEAQRQRTEAQRRYRQACEQVEQSLQATVEQLKPMVSQFTASVHSASPPWEDAAWQDWKPADMARDIVRFGMLTFTPSQDLQRR